ncbi:hypothetical protein EVAR_61657_1 [Eumeta japonica]|uniref:Uncharacterized protein n=1 Tax=Eumeta variegata TaxID=151549 RepID=A0A4C1Z7R1_EUMVA|nr:hypothetical protein EVAR_61657_1 [Eumeta japonica]
MGLWLSALSEPEGSSATAAAVDRRGGLKAYVVQTDMKRLQKHVRRHRADCNLIVCVEINTSLRSVEPLREALCPLALRGHSFVTLYHESSVGAVEGRLSRRSSVRLTRPRYNPLNQS